MEPFKNKLNPYSIKELSLSFKNIDPTFDHINFMNLACVNLENLELRDRAVQICLALDQTVNGSKKMIAKKIKMFLVSTDLSGFILWPISIFIEKNYVNDFKVGMELLEELTKKFTSEFGIRPFFDQYPDKTYEYFLTKINHENEHVRRWISEGTRPNLPWGMNISHIKDNLERNINLIENLIDDSSLYVRKSVANHMSDISMINPNLALKYLEKWYESGSESQKSIVKQALRNLIKQGNKKALSILGFSQTFKILIEKVLISPKKVTDGDFTTLKVQITSLKKQSLMIDYILGYPKKNGQITKKVFKLKSINALKNEIISIEKKISFKKVTTRVHYPGTHTFELQINGKIVSNSIFTLIAN